MSASNPYLQLLATLETRNGEATVKGPSGEDSFNLFNIKEFRKGRAGFRALDKVEGSRDSYRVYASHADAEADLTDLLRRNYPEAYEASQQPWSLETATQFAQGLQNGVGGRKYATDPAYVEKLVKLAGSIDTDAAKSYRGSPAAQQQAATASVLAAAEAEAQALAAKDYRPTSQGRANADKTEQALRNETGFTDVAAAALTDPRVMGTWAILDRLNRPAADPNWVYADHFQRLEKGLEEDEVELLRENARSEEGAQQLLNRIAYQRQLDRTVYGRAGTAANFFGQFAAGMLDPAGLVAGAGTAAALGRFSRGLIQAGKAKSAVGISVAESAIGEVAYEGILDLSGEVKTSEDYLMAATIGGAMQVPFSYFDYKAARNHGIANDLRQLADTQTKQLQAQAWDSYSNLWAQGLSKKQMETQQTMAATAVAAEGNAVAPADNPNVVIPSDLQAEILAEDSPTAARSGPVAPPVPEGGTQAPAQAAEPVAPPAAPVLVTAENASQFPELLVAPEWGPATTQPAKMELQAETWAAVAKAAQEAKAAATPVEATAAPAVRGPTSEQVAQMDSYMQSVDTLTKLLDESPVETLAVWESADEAALLELGVNFDPDGLSLIGEFKSEDAVGSIIGKVDAALAKATQAKKDYLESLAAWEPEPTPTSVVAPTTVAPTQAAQSPNGLAALIKPKDAAILPGEQTVSWTGEVQSVTPKENVSKFTYSGVFAAFNKPMNLTKVDSAKGGNPGGVYQDEQGNKFYVKFPPDAAAARNEVAAIQAYRAVGVRTIDLRLGEFEGKMATISPMHVFGEVPWSTVGELSGTPKKLAWDMIFANRDGWGDKGTPFADNVALNSKGQLVLVDAGGALEYTGIGDKKPYWHSTAAAEIEALDLPWTQFGKVWDKLSKDGQQDFYTALEAIRASWQDENFRNDLAESLASILVDQDKVNGLMGAIGSRLNSLVVHFQDKLPSSLGSKPGATNAIPATAKTQQVVEAIKSEGDISVPLLTTAQGSVKFAWGASPGAQATEAAHSKNVVTMTMRGLLQGLRQGWTGNAYDSFANWAGVLLNRVDPRIFDNTQVAFRVTKQTGWYDAKKGTVMVPVDKAKADLFAGKPISGKTLVKDVLDERAKFVLMHEVAHAATQLTLLAVNKARSLKKGPKVNPKVLSAVDTLEKLRVALAAKVGVSDSGAGYAAGDLAEFVAQAMSDLETVQALQAMPATNPAVADNGAEELRRAILNVLGLPSSSPHSAFNEAIQGIHTLLLTRGQILDKSGQVITSVWKNPLGAAASAPLSPAKLSGLKEVEGNRPHTIRDLLDQGLVPAPGWEKLVNKLKDSPLWPASNDPADFPVFWHGTKNKSSLEDSLPLMGFNPGFADSIYGAYFLSSKIGLSAGTFAKGSGSGVYAVIPTVTKIFDFRNPEHVKDLEALIHKHSDPGKVAGNLELLKAAHESGDWTYMDSLRKEFLTPFSSYEAHWEVEGGGKSHGMVEVGTGGVFKPVASESTGTQTMNLAVWKSNGVKMLLENDGSFDLDDYNPVSAPKASPQQQVATQLRFAKRMYEHARQYVKKNPIDLEKVKTLTAKWDYMLSDGLKLARSKNPIAQMIAAMIPETTTGAAGRGTTAAIRKELLHRKLIGNSLLKTEGLYTAWRDRNGGSTVQDFSNGDHRRRWERAVYEEIVARRKTKARVTGDADVAAAADEWQAMFERALREQKQAQVLGSSYLPEDSWGYVPQALDGDKLAVASMEDLKMLQDHLADHFSQVLEWNKDFSATFAQFYVNRARMRAQGEKGFDGINLDGNSTNAVKEALEDMGLEPQALTKALAAVDRVGGQSQTKKRLDVDLLGTLPNGKKVLDYYVNDVSKLARQYANRTAGAVALAEYGILGWRGVRNLMQALRLPSDNPAEAASLEEITAAERILAEILGTPWAGEKRSAVATGARMFVGLQRLGGLVFTQASEAWNMAHTLGLGATLRGIASLPRVISEARAVAKGGQLPEGHVLRSLEVYGGEIGMSQYKMVARLDAPDELLREYQGNGVALRLLSAGSQLQSKLSFFRGLQAAQHRMVAEQILRKAARYIKDRKTASQVDVYLTDMGFTPELVSALRDSVNTWAKFDSRGNLMEFDITKFPSAKAAEAFTQAVHRGTFQIIQGTFAGERGAWAHNDYAQLLLQLRTFGLTSIEKQWGRTRMNSGVAYAVGALLAQMALATPIYTARVVLASQGREDQEEYLENNLAPARLVRAVMNYSALSGLSGDVLDLMAGIAGGWGGAEVAETVGARQQAASVGSLIPVAGSIDTASKVLSGKADLSTALRQLPMSNLWYLTPLINIVGELPND